MSSTDIRCVVLSGTKKAPVFQCKERVLLPRTMTASERAVWLETQLELLLNKFTPDAVAYRATLGVRTYDQVQSTYYADAVLHLLCGRRNINITHYFRQSIKPKKLGLDKDTDIYGHVDATLGQHAPYWDNHTREAALVAWFELED